MGGSLVRDRGMVSGSNATLLVTFGIPLLPISAGRTSEEDQMHNFSYEEPPHHLRLI